MISVLNHLQPLNGNKKTLWLVTLLLVSIMSIAQVDDEVGESIELSNVNPYAHLDSSKTKRDPVYHIVYVLPVNVPAIKSISTNSMSPIQIPLENKEALAFWEGVNLALPKIKQLNAKFKLHIFDNAKNDSMTYRITKMMDGLKITAVVAPFHSQQSKIIADYCKGKKIPVFLPQNPSDAPALNNPYAFKLFTSRNRLYLKYYKDLENDPRANSVKIHYFYNDVIKSEISTAKFLSTMTSSPIVDSLNEFTDDSRKINFVPLSKNPDFKSILHRGKKNFVMITAVNEKNINELIAKIKTIDANVQILGQSSWPNSQNLKLDVLEELNTQVFSDFYIDRKNSEILALSSQYYAMTKDNVLSETFAGYDLACYIATIVDKYGANYPLYISRFYYKGLVNNYVFKPILNSKGSISFFENENKNIIRAFKDGWMKMN